MKIKVFTTGGTIDKVYFDANSEFQVGIPAIEAIFKEANVSVDVEIKSLMRKDSLEITADDRQQILDSVSNCSLKNILVTHGTDTMAETAAVLQSITDKTVVLTGAMQPASLRSTDAIFNIGFAIAATQTLPAGVYIAMNGRVFKAGNVKKNVKEQRFESL